MNAQIAIQRKLQDEFIGMRTRNPLFSLRAYARKLQLNPSAVSEILQGKRRVSRKLAQKILTQICQDPKEAQGILTLFAVPKISGTSHESQYTILPIDQFQTIASWHHFAIHSLIATKGFKSDPTWIAKRLGIRGNDVISALERMERIGMITWDRKKKKILAKEVQFSTPQDIVSSAIRASHREDLEMAAKKMEEIAVELREFTSVTMGIDNEKIPAAKKMIREFRDKLSEYLESGVRSEVYRMCVHFYPLTKIEERV